MSRITLSDRFAIEAGIYARLNLTEIAERINKSPRYVSEELRRNGTKISGVYPLGKRCHNAAQCSRTGLCGREGCDRECYTCREKDCQELCMAFHDAPCEQLRRAPYVCNTCVRRRQCRMDRSYYSAQQADAAAKRRYSQARSKPHLSADELAALDAVVSPLIRKGQPLTHIFADRGADISVSQRTLYHYINAGFLSVGNLDLRRKVRYRPRRKKSDGEAIGAELRRGRSYDDFCEHITRYPNTAYVEMDTVRGSRSRGKRMLTMLFTEQNLMLIFLLRDGKAESVVELFDWLTSTLGLENFRELFPIILTDNGAEFKLVEEMEYTPTGDRRTRIFYCDPQAAWQKPHIEKNHEYIRYVLPKGKSFDRYTQEDMLLLANHINSTRRRKLNGKTPFELASSLPFQQLKRALGLCAVDARDIDLTPHLLSK